MIVECLSCDCGLDSLHLKLLTIVVRADTFLAMYSTVTHNIKITDWWSVLFFWQTIDLLLNTICWASELLIVKTGDKSKFYTGDCDSCTTKSPKMWVKNVFAVFGCIYFQNDHHLRLHCSLTQGVRHLQNIRHLCLLARRGHGSCTISGMLLAKQ